MCLYGVFFIKQNRSHSTQHTKEWASREEGREYKGFWMQVGLNEWESMGRSQGRWDLGLAGGMDIRMEGMLN